MGARVATAIAGLVASILLSVVAWVYFDLPVFLVFLPFVPLLFRQRQASESPPVRACPVCGFSTGDPSYDYCPRDGERLE